MRAAIEIGAAEVDLHGHDVVGRARERDGRLLVLLDSTAPDADDDARSRVAQLR